jgi:hypothetical protein
MVNELDFEEIDQVLEDMNNLDGITNAIAEDVAKIDSVVKKTTSQKRQKSSGNVVKNTTSKATPKAKKPTPKPPAVAKESVKDSAKDTAKDTAKNTDEPPAESQGESVLVKVKKKPAPEPEIEEVVFQPNPKTGKFMDIVSPLSDMSIQGTRPLKDDVKNTSQTPILITETSVVATVTTPVAAEDEYIEKDDKIADRERIEEAGLNPDAAIGDLANQLEDISDDDSSDPLDDILQSFDGGEDGVETEIADDVESDLEKLADILDIPDHSDAFLENVEISKRPLGGGEEAASVIGATAVAEAELDTPASDEIEADREFIEDSKGLDEWLGDKKSNRSKPAKADKLAKLDKPAKLENFSKPAKKSNLVLYILLFVLFAILGISLGVLAFFSGLF